MRAVSRKDNYGYEVAKTGRSQHIGILYDKRYVNLNAVCECDIPEEERSKKNLFDRQPFFAHFTLMQGVFKLAHKSGIIE